MKPATSGSPAAGFQIGLGPALYTRYCGRIALRLPAGRDLPCWNHSGQPPAGNHHKGEDTAMTTPLTTEERLSHLEGVVQNFATPLNNVVTREEMQANVATLLRAIENIRAEARADAREAEARITRWTVGSIFAAATLAVAALKLIP